MAQPIASLPQPDFNRVSQGLQMASTELQKCPNLPALQQGNEILQAIQTLTDSFERSQQETRRRFDQIDQRFTQIDQRFTQIDRRFTQIDQRFTQIETRLDRIEARFDTMEARQLASEHNAVSRLYNRMLHSPDDELRPLVDTQNRAVDQFPRTSRVLNNMTVPVLTTVLQALGAATDGAREQKRLTLRLVVGLPTNVP